MGHNAITIFPKGDTVLQLGQAKFFVASQMVSEASSIFASLLSNRGTTLAQVIQLEGDDKVALEIMLNVIHAQNGRVPLQINLGLLIQLARLVEKYALHTVVVPWVDHWTKDWQLRVVADQCHTKWLYVAWILRARDIFEFASLAMVLDYSAAPDGTIDGLQHSELRPYFPRAILGTFDPSTSLPQTVYKFASNPPASPLKHNYFCFCFLLTLCVTPVRPSIRRYMHQTLRDGPRAAATGQQIPTPVLPLDDATRVQARHGPKRSLRQPHLRRHLAALWGGLADGRPMVEDVQALRARDREAAPEMYEIQPTPPGS